MSGVFSLAVADSIAEIFPSSVSDPVPVTIMVPLPWVTGVFMNAMSVWSPGPSPVPSGPGRPWPRGRSRR